MANYILYEEILNKFFYKPRSHRKMHFFCHHFCDSAGFGMFLFNNKLHLLENYYSNNCFCNPILQKKAMCMSFSVKKTPCGVQYLQQHFNSLVFVLSYFLPHFRKTHLPFVKYRNQKASNNVS